MTAATGYPGDRPTRSGTGPVRVLAHRGGLGPWRENTVEAFEGALALGADGVELDVRRGADQVPLVNHDAEVAGFGLVSDLSSKRRPPWLPTLEESLVACAGAVVNVEIKNPPLEPGHDPEETLAAAVAQLLRRSASWPARRRPALVVVSSFQPSSLAAVRSEYEDVPVGLLLPGFVDVSAKSGPGSQSPLEQAASLGCAAMHLHHARLSEGVVDEVHAAGMGVVAWTVNDPRRAQELADWGADAVITDAVETTLRALGRRGGLVRDVGRRGQSSS